MEVFNTLFSQRHIVAMRRRHKEMVSEYDKYGDTMNQDLVFPIPPISGTPEIVPLRTADEVWNEGKLQRNCVGLMEAKIFEIHKLLYYAYKVLSPERATLTLKRASDGSWKIDQLKQEGNWPVHAQTTKLVQDWLDNHQQTKSAPA